MGKTDKLKSDESLIGKGIIIAIVGTTTYLLRKLKQHNVEKNRKQEKLSVFEKDLDEFFLKNKDKNTIFKEFMREKVLLTRDERFEVLKTLLRDYEIEFKKEFNLISEFFDSGIELKGEREAENIREFIEDGNENPYRDKLKEISLKYNIEIKESISSILNVDKSQLKQINEDVLIDFNILKSGIEGEKRVIKELDKFSNEYKILSNKRLKVSNDEIEFDNLIISDKGILIFEVKNIGEYGKCKLIVTKDGQYKKVKNGHEYILNGNTPSSQLYHHAIKLENMLKQELKSRGCKCKTLNVKPMVVIANDNVEIENESETTIIRVSEIFYHIFENNKTRFLFNIFNKHSELSNELKNEISNIIVENTVKDKKFEAYVPKDIIYTVKSNLDAIKFVKDINKFIEICK